MIGATLEAEELTTAPPERRPRRTAGKARRQGTLDSLEAALRSEALHDAVVETLTEHVPEGASYRGVAVQVAQTIAGDLASRIGPVLARAMFPRHAGPAKPAVPEHGEPWPAAELPPDLTDAELEELALAEDAARVRMFELYWQAASRRECPEVAFITAIVESARVPLKRPGALLTAYRWGLLNAANNPLRAAARRRKR